jgi:hypothetical protein
VLLPAPTAQRFETQLASLPQSAPGAPLVQTPSV